MPGRFITREMKLKSLPRDFGVSTEDVQPLGSKYIGISKK